VVALAWERQDMTLVIPRLSDLSGAGMYFIVSRPEYLKGPVHPH